MTKFERLMAKVSMPDGCWLWTGATNPKGYGTIRSGPRGESHLQFAHRAMWEATHGPIVGPANVLHHCDTPACVRPDHLYLGTPADNAHDRTIRARGRAKLTSAQVRLMREAHANGWSLTAIAGQFGVAVPTVHNVIHRVTWKHVA